MSKAIVAGLLGFFTLPFAALIIIGLSVIGKWIGSFGMDSVHYWDGLTLAVGIAVIFFSTMPFWSSEPF